MKDISDDVGPNILDALQAMNRHLSMINGRLEMLIRLDLPPYIISDLTQVYQAEQEVSQILRGLNHFCHRNF